MPSVLHGGEQTLHSLTLVAESTQHLLDEILSNYKWGMSQAVPVMINEPD